MYYSSSKLSHWPSWLPLRKEFKRGLGAGPQGCCLLAAVLMGSGSLLSVLCHLPAALEACHEPRSKVSLADFPGKCNIGKVDITVILEPPVQELELGGWDAVSSQWCPPKGTSKYLLCRRSLKEVLVLLTCLISAQCWDIDVGLAALAVSVTTQSFSSENLFYYISFLTAVFSVFLIS